MNRVFLFLLGALLALQVQAEPVSFGLFGDTPYNQWEKDNLPDLMAQMDRENLAFIVHDGDIKSGSSLCSDEALKNILNLFQSSATPLVYVPGDNEWTDCHRRIRPGENTAEKERFRQGEERFGLLEEEILGHAVDGLA